MALFIISLNLEDVANYYKSLDNFYSDVQIVFYKSRKNKVMYYANGSFYESRDKTYYTGYLKNGSKFLIEYKNDSSYLYLDGELIKIEFQNYPVISPYKMFLYLYTNNFAYTVREKEDLFEITFYTDGKPFKFLLNTQYKIIEYNPQLSLKFIFN